MRSTSTGGMHAPEPSKTIDPGSSDAASAAPAGTFDSNGAPANPPPTLRHPTVRTPAITASSRKSDAACEPDSAMAISSSSEGPASATRGSAGPPRPMQTITRVRSLLAEQRRPVPGHGGLARALAGGDHRQFRPLERHGLVVRRDEPRARRLVGEAETQRKRRQPQLRRGRQRRARPRGPPRRPRAARAGAAPPPGLSPPACRSAARAAPGRASPRRRRRPPRPDRAGPAPRGRRTGGAPRR